LAFVHPNSEREAQAIAEEYGLADVPRFSDPEGVLYRAFGLGRARVWQFLTWKSLKRYWQAWRGGHRGGRPTADVLRMPGVILLHRGEIVRAFRHRGPTDRPDYLSLAAPV
jgi:hypothetical protein